MRAIRIASAALVAVAFAAGHAHAKGTPDWKSAGPIAFGPDGTVLLADTQGASVFAVDLGDKSAKASRGPIEIKDLGVKVAEALGTTADKITVADMAVNPESGRVYLSVSRGKGPDASPALVRVGRDGKVQVVSLENVEFAKAELPDAPNPGKRVEAITDLAYSDGRVFVAGLSNEEFSSRLLALPYPFADKGKSTSIEIFHGAHGRLETKSPVRTFVATKIKGEPNLLAAYTCTPLVKIPVAELKSGSHLKGTTIAELGNRNKPLDMITYSKDGKEYLLMANSSRGVMKIPAEGADSAPGITKPVKTEKEGQSYETLSVLKGVEQLDKLDDATALILVKTPSGALDLQTIDLP